MPVQDVLGLGSDARMNLPGGPEGNWAWRLRDGELGGEQADRLAELAETYGRERNGVRDRQSTPRCRRGFASSLGEILASLAVSLAATRSAPSPGAAPRRSPA